MKGKVYLVGAGPGDPELLTLKAAGVLRNADVVLHDDLVGPQILDFAPPHAQRHNVGKRCGNKKISQAEINFLMVHLASLGHRVVRLKGGDPLVFGRAAEEIAALREADIEFEIVPGITAALGACSSAEISLTDRRSSHALIFLAGHHAVENDPTNWQALVSSGGTLVIYMPGYHYGTISRKLQAGGLAGETPCAVISRATTADEQLFTTDLENLPGTPQLPAPTLLVIGEVVRHATHNPLFKQSISRTSRLDRFIHLLMKGGQHEGGSGKNTSTGRAVERSRRVALGIHHISEPHRNCFGIWRRRNGAD
jgi:uroporphyrin-III C-methyltransferase